MAWFGFGSKKDNSGESVCRCRTNNAAQNETAAECCPNTGSEAGKKLSIKVLGSGCKRCRELFESAQEAVADLRWDADVEYITDYEKIAGYGAMSLPALVVNEKIVSCGKVLAAEEIARLLRFICNAGRLGMR